MSSRVHQVVLMFEPSSDLHLVGHVFAVVCMAASRQEDRRRRREHNYCTGSADRSEPCVVYTGHMSTPAAFQDRETGTKESQLRSSLALLAARLKPCSNVDASRRVEEAREVAWPAVRAGMRDDAFRQAMVQIQMENVDRWLARICVAHLDRPRDMSGKMEEKSGGR